MKVFKVLAMCLALSAAFAEDKLPGKTISIGQEHFSKIYPAVWLCPDDASISPLTEKSEEPPAEKYRIWIEPGDPEIATPPFEGPITRKPFLAIGTGKQAYTKARLGDTGKELRSIGRSEATGENPVFIYREEKRQWVFMILTSDRKQEKLTFIWRELSE